MPGFVAEYAKSGRSSCRGCKSAIAQGSCRIGRMVPSPHFDGDMAMWYHERCLKDKIADASLIEGLLALKPEDQKRLRAKYSGGATAGAVEPAETTVSSGILDAGTICVDYAKSSRSMCRLCGDAIPQGSLRLGPMEFAEHERFSGLCPSWHCFVCFSKSRYLATAAMESIDGLQAIDAKDKKKIEKLIKKSSPAAKEEKAKGKRKKNSDDAETAAADEKPNKKMKVEESKAASDEFESNTVNELRALLKSQDLDSKGKKAELIQRLRDAEESKAAPQVKVEADQGESKKNKKRGRDAEKENSSSQSFDELLESESKAKWAIRAKLTMTRQQVKEILQYNSYETDGKNPEFYMDLLVDSLLYGAIPKCPECGRSSLYFSVDDGEFKCRTHLQWSNCMYTVDQVKRSEFQIPPEYTEVNVYFSQYKWNKSLKKPVEAFRAAAEKSKKLRAEMNQKHENRTKGIEEVRERRLTERQLFEGFKVCLVGKFSVAQKIVENSIQTRAGKIVEAVADSPDFIVSSSFNPKSLSKNAKKEFLAARELGIPIVNESFVFDSISANRIQFDKFVDPNAVEIEGAQIKILQNRTDVAKKSGSGSGGMSKSSKFQLKGRSAVDPDCEVAEFTSVLDEGRNELYSAILNKTDAVKNVNSFYVLQLVVNEKRTKYYVFRKWGRIGSDRGGNKLENFINIDEAKKLFFELFLEKTGVSWPARLVTPKQPGMFALVEVDYSAEAKAAEEISSSRQIQSRSTLDARLQETIRMFFDVGRMQAVLIELDIDTQKMPLGKLSKSAIERGLKLLRNIEKLVTNEKKKPAESQLIAASNEFYSVIPHNFGSSPVEIIRSVDQLTKRLEMIEALREMEIANSVMKAEAKSEQEDSASDPIDIHYRSLNTGMQPIEMSDPTMKIINSYVKNTHGSTHANFSLELLNVFAVDRSGESDRFRPFAATSNRQLLWHGSRITNFVGILSQGLRIAPPEAPITGSMFAHGIYFANSVSKSANYTQTSQSNPIAYMLLCEVALGEMNELKQADYEANKKLGNKYLSTKGVGKFQPNPKGNVTMQDGVIVPAGKLTASGPADSALLYDEFIVYQLAQVKIRYLVQLKFNFSRQ